MVPSRPRFKGSPGRLYEIPILLTIIAVGLAVAIPQPGVGRKIAAFLLTGLAFAGLLIAAGAWMWLTERIEATRSGRAILAGLWLLGWFVLFAFVGGMAALLPAFTLAETPQGQDRWVIAGAVVVGLAGLAARLTLQDDFWPAALWGLGFLFCLLAGAMLGLVAGALWGASPAVQLACGAAGGLGACGALAIQAGRVWRRRRSS